MDLPHMTGGVKATKIDTSGLAVFGMPALAIGVSILIAFFVVWPKFSQALSLRAANSELTVRVEALDLKADVLASLDRSELETQLALSEQLLPSDKGAFVFVRQIENAAATSGVFLDRVDLVPGNLKTDDTGENSPPVVGDNAKPSISPSLQVRVSTTSNYSSLISFLGTLFSISRVTGINELTIASESDDEGVSALKATFVIDAFWRPLPSQLGSIESAVSTLSASELEVLANARILESGGGATPVVPQVPTGRADLFSPF